MFKTITQHPGYGHRPCIKENHLLESHPHLNRVTRSLEPGKVQSTCWAGKHFQFGAQGPKTHTQIPARELWVSAGEIDNKALSPQSCLPKAALLLKIKKRRYQN